MKSSKSDPQTYAKMLEPYQSNDEAARAYDGFAEELYELRKKYRIPDLYFVAELMVMLDGRVGSAMISGHFGNPTRKPMLAAYGFGESKAEFESDLANLQSEGQKSVKR